MALGNVLRDGLWRMLYRQERQQAKRRNLEFTLTYEQFCRLSGSPCFYCGHKPYKSAKGWVGFNNSRPHKDFLFQGIDRISSEFGYIPNNCVPACKRCNYLKRDLTVEELLCLITRIMPSLLELHTENLTKRLGKGLRPSMERALESAEKIINSSTAERLQVTEKIWRDFAIPKLEQYSLTSKTNRSKKR